MNWPEEDRGLVPPSQESDRSGETPAEEIPPVAPLETDSADYSEQSRAVELDNEQE